VLHRRAIQAARLHHSKQIKQGAHDLRRVNPKEPRKENLAASLDLIVGTA
jgi:hypothetical protein